jgi:hypothetical protein
MSTKVEIRANKYVDGENSVLFQWKAGEQ